MKRPDMVILHGWNLSGNRFAPLANVLTKLGYRVFTLDFPGFGKEPPPSSPWHVTDYAEFLKKYFEKKRIRKPILIGHSFGGRVALQFTYMYPNVPQKLVITGTPGYSPVPQKKMTFFLVLAKIGGVLFLLPGLNLLADFARKVLYRLAGAREFYRAEGSMRQTFKNIVKDDLVPAMQAIRVPCLLVWGQCDSVVPLAVADRMNRTMPKSKLIVVQNATHVLPFSDPDLFVSKIWKFLQS